MYVDLTESLSKIITNTLFSLTKLKYVVGMQWWNCCRPGEN